MGSVRKMGKEGMESRIPREAGEIAKNYRSQHFATEKEQRSKTLGTKKGRAKTGIKRCGEGNWELKLEPSAPPLPPPHHHPIPTLPVYLTKKGYCFKLLF